MLRRAPREGRHHAVSAPGQSRNLCARPAQRPRHARGKARGHLELQPARRRGRRRVRLRARGRHLADHPRRPRARPRRHHRRVPAHQRAQRARGARPAFLRPRLRGREPADGAHGSDGPADRRRGRPVLVDALGGSGCHERAGPGPRLGRGRRGGPLVPLRTAQTAGAPAEG